MTKIARSLRSLFNNWVSLLAIGVFTVLPFFSAYAVDTLFQDGEVHALKEPLSFAGYGQCLGPRSMIDGRDWWVVYADRDGIPIYEDSKAMTALPGKTLNFLEELFVLGEDTESKMLLLGESDSLAMGERKPKISEIVGWVKWDHLIVSNEPIRNPETLISRKAFIINDWRQFKEKDIDEFKENMVVVRAGPSEDARELRKITGIRQRFSYIYKYDPCTHRNPGWYLIGKRKIIHYGPVYDNIVGWIPSVRAQPWETRQALEPVPDRPGPAHVYFLRDEVADPEARPLLWDRMVREPWPADKSRYPVLEHEPGDGAVRIAWHGILGIMGNEVGSGYAMDAFILDVLTRQARDPEALRIFITEKVELFETGWVRMSDDQGRALMRPVQLVSLSELNETERALRRLFRPDLTPDRAELLARWRKIVGAVIGEQPSSAREYLSISGGILFRDESKFLSMDFDGIMAMPDDRLSEMLAYVKKAVKAVQALRTDRADIWFLNYSHPFAWIPMEELP
jgi:hypothetical protein